MFPKGYEPQELPKTIELDSPWFRGAVSFMAGSEGKVLCRAELRTIATEGTGDRLEEWNKAVRDVAKASATPVIFIKSNH